MSGRADVTPRPAGGSRAGGPPPGQQAGGSGRGFGPGPFGMGAPAVKAKDFKGAGRRLLRLLRPHAGAIGAIVLLAVVSVAFNVLGPAILGRATNVLFEGVISARIPPGETAADYVSRLAQANNAAGRRLAELYASMTLTPGTGVDWAHLRRLLLLLAILYPVSAVFQWLQQRISVTILQQVVYELRAEADRKLARLPLAYFDDHPRGDVLSRVTNDVDNIATSLQQSLTQVLASLFSVVGVLGMMFWLNWPLAAVSLLTMPASLAVTMAVAARAQKQFALQWQRTGALNALVEETHTGRNVVKAFGRSGDVAARFDAENEKLFEAGFRAQFISGVIQPALAVVANLNYVVIAVVGGWQVATGRLSLGSVQAFMQYSRQFSWPIMQLASVANVLQSAVASAERVFELLDEPEEPADPAVPAAVERARGAIAMQGVSFRYRPDTPLIDNLDLVVSPGQTVAIVGPTGAGKTTLVNLLLRFYEIDAGVIRVDGVNTREMSRDGLRRLFGMVLQDAWLFSGTIRENLAYGREDATEEAIVAAAAAAHVDHFVRTLPDGYDTRLDDDAAGVSAGEKQLLTIARAFLADPQILILDEATSSVDTRTEALIQKAMAGLMKGRTAFVIAHRLSTIRDADVILVMDHGRIVEKGTHESLLASRGFYHDLYRSQFELAEA
jgi:ATP-binding cassette, subfamily B, multidrug efflux pump